QTGVDIYLGFSADDHSVIDGARSESLKFCESANAHRVTISGCTVTHGSNLWPMSSGVVLNTLIRSTDGTKSDGRLWKCTTAGPTGSSEPNCNSGSPLTDNTAVWTALEFDIVKGTSLNIQNCTFPHGRIRIIGSSSGNYPNSINNLVVSRKDWLGGDPYSGYS